MVNKRDLPIITWEEDFGPEDERRVSGLIVATITAGLALPADGCERLFFVVPTPTPYTKAEAEMLSAFGEKRGAAEKLRIVALPRAGRCYVTSGEMRFRELLPHAFRLGPPELTFIAANCEFDHKAAQSDIVTFVLEALAKTPSSTNDVAGMHFDSGDLVELF
jgi:hypothetical protein